MRARRSFRPVLESLSTRLVLSDYGVTNPLAPILVPQTPPPPAPLPTDPIMVPVGPAIDPAIYVGPDTGSNLDPGLTINA